jgi:hypothetical protein
MNELPTCTRWWSLQATSAVPEDLTQAAGSAGRYPKLRSSRVSRLCENVQQVPVSFVVATIARSAFGTFIREHRRNTVRCRMNFIVFARAAQEAVRPAPAVVWGVE